MAHHITIVQTAKLLPIVTRMLRILNSVQKEKIIHHLTRSLEIYLSK